jgi:hypothetical protein
MVLNSPPNPSSPGQAPYHRVSSIVHSASRIEHHFYKLPILPIFMPLCLRGYKSIMQNKPNFKIVKIALTHCHKKNYGGISRHRARKNKPNQTQSCDTRSAARYPLYAARCLNPLSRPTRCRGLNGWTTRGSRRIISPIFHCFTEYFA